MHEYEQLMEVEAEIDFLKSRIQELQTVKKLIKQRIQSNLSEMRKKAYEKNREYSKQRAIDKIIELYANVDIDQCNETYTSPASDVDAEKILKNYIRGVKI